MKIKSKHIEPTAFYKLQAGAVFRAYDETFLKIHPIQPLDGRDDDIINAVNLADGDPAVFEDDTEVIPLHAELLIHEDTDSETVFPDENEDNEESGKEPMLDSFRYRDVYCQRQGDAYVTFWRGMPVKHDSIQDVIKWTDENF